MSDAPKHIATPDAPAANAKTQERMNDVKVADTHIAPAGAGKAVAPTSQSVGNQVKGTTPASRTPPAGSENN